MTTPSTESPLKFRWWQELIKNPPTLPIWTESHGLMGLVALALNGYANPDGSNIFPSAETVGKVFGIHRKTVGKYRKALVDLGMIALVRKGGGKGDSSRYRLCETRLWRHTVEAGFDAAMAAHKPVAETMAEPTERERVRAALQGALDRNALDQVRHEWARVIEQDAVLSALYGTRRAEFQRLDHG